MKLASDIWTKCVDHDNYQSWCHACLVKTMNELCKFLDDPKSFKQERQVTPVSEDNGSVVVSCEFLTRVDSICSYIAARMSTTDDINKELLAISLEARDRLRDGRA